MLKKKNIAMMMAAATVITTAAPAFAATIEKTEVDEATLIAKVQELLNTKYSDAKENGVDDNQANIVEGQEYTNSVYAIKTDDNTDVKSISQLKTLIENAKVSEKELVLSVSDKGHKTVDGKIVAEETTKNDFYKDLSLDIDATAEAALVELGASVKADKSASEATIVLANNSEIKLQVADYVLDLGRPVDANGKLVDKTNLTTSVKKSIVGFEKKAADKATAKEIPTKEVSKLSFNGSKFVEVSKNASDILTEDGYTKDGATFVNTMIDAKAGTKEVIKDGVKYNLSKAATTDVIVSKEGGYKFEVTLEAVKASDAKAISNVKILVKGNVQKDLATIKTAIDTGAQVADVDGKIGKLVGDDRFETAVEISKKSYDKEAAKAVVLVGEEAIVDGLAAAPLSSAAEAPILLTKKDAVPTSTMNEIKRAVKEKGAKIYLVGGEANISKEVEKQLISEMNAEIVRIAGDDRNETSLKIAKELKSVKGNVDFTKHFVVGGDGLADAMSVASIAAKKGEEAPILVTPATGLTKDAKTFLKDNTTAGSEATVVGGEDKVSTQVLKDIKAENNATITRLAGEDRHETNAKVIADLAKNAPNSLDNVYTAKSGYVPNNGDALLVDALAAAPLAAQNNGVIVLATDEVTKTQETAVKAAVKDNKGTKLTQVGGGVNANVIQKLVKILGL